MSGQGKSELEQKLEEPGVRPVTTDLPGRPGEITKVTTEPGSYAVDRSFNPDPSLSERERAAGHAEAGELPGGGLYAVQERSSAHHVEKKLPGGVIGAQVTPGAEPIKNSQGNKTGEGSSTSIMTDPWVDSELSNLFNRDEKTFAVGDTIVSNDVTKDMESCALKCQLSDYCEIFAFCADSAGCSVSGMMCGAGATVPVGTCVLSMYTAVKTADGKISDNVNGTAMLGATGPKVGFTSGYYFVDTAPGLPFLEVPLAVDATFNIDRHTFYALPAGIAAATTSKAANVSECASACYGNSTCDAFVFCPVDQQAGCSVPGYSCSDPTTVAAGDCLLQSDVNPEQTAFLKLDSSLLATISGIRKAVPDDLPAPAPAPAKAA